MDLSQYVQTDMYCTCSINAFMIRVEGKIILLPPALHSLEGVV